MIVYRSTDQEGLVGEGKSARMKRENARRINYHGGS